MNILSIQILTLGGLLVEIMRMELDKPLSRTAAFNGPYPSGDTAIFISTAARLDGACAIIGAVGDDPFGECIVNRLKLDGVDTSFINVRHGATTGTAFVAYASDGSRSFVYHWRHAAAGMMFPQDIDATRFSDVKWVHITGVTLSVNDNCRDTVYQLLKHLGPNVKISFDPNIRPEVLSIEQIKKICAPVMERADIVFPSSGEAMMFTGAKDDDTGCRMLAEQGKLAVLKCGDKGCRIYSSHHEVISIPAYKVKEVDPTGAGDAFCAGFITALNDGLSLYDAGLFANAVGALTVTKQGPMEGVPYRKDVEALMEKQALPSE